MAKKNEGKVFEESVKQSCEKEGIFFYRIKDTFIPMEYRTKIRVSKNDYDSFAYTFPMLIPLELKSTKGKSFSFDEKIIKAHQIEALEKAANNDGVLAGFLFNFRESDNRTFYVHIKDFLSYKEVAENELEHNYKNKVNKKSISIKICEEIGIEIQSTKKKVKYHYHMKDFFNLMMIANSNLLYNVVDSLLAKLKKGDKSEQY